MANKKIKELRNLSANELQVKLREVERGLFDARMKKKTGQLEDVNQLWKLRKELARMKTLLTQQQQKSA
jgi:large subunit ribosomal protein L29